MPTTPRSLQAICRACPVRNSADCLIDAQGLRLHTSTNHCPVFTQHTASNELPYTRKLFNTKAFFPRFSQHLLRKGDSKPTITKQGDGAVRPQQIQTNKEKGIQGKGIQEERGIQIYSLASTKTLDSTGQSNLTITLVSCIRSSSVCQNFCQCLSAVPRCRSPSSMYAKLDCWRRLPLDRPQEEKQQSASNLVAALRQS